jgi:hypothetical protein
MRAKRPGANGNRGETTRANGDRGETTQGANGIRGETTRYLSKYKHEITFSRQRAPIENAWSTSGIF